jgi:hypothetical protein
MRGVVSSSAEFGPGVSRAATPPKVDRKVIPARRKMMSLCFIVILLLE